MRRRRIPITVLPKARKAFDQLSPRYQRYILKLAIRHHAPSYSLRSIHIDGLVRP